MKFPIAIGLLATLAAASPVAPARAADPAALATAIRQLNGAVVHAQPAGIRAARAAFAALAADEPGSATLQYWIALADWRVVPLLMKDDPEQARKLCKEGIAACDRAIATDAKFADAMALRAGLQGLSLSFVPSAAMTLGPEMEEAYGRAAGLAPENPRVELIAAINTLHKPAFVGGGAEKARPRFDRAVALFAGAATAADSTAIAWGADDALLWAGRCRAELGDWKGAIERYRKVLAIAPEHAWVRGALLPEAESHLDPRTGEVRAGEGKPGAAAPDSGKAGSPNAPGAKRGGQ
jgi:tetratricopeptide (TPR) repeat protein